MRERLFDRIETDTTHGRSCARLRFARRHEVRPNTGRIMLRLVRKHASSCCSPTCWFYGVIPAATITTRGTTLRRGVDMMTMPKNNARRSTRTVPVLGALALIPVTVLILSGCMTGITLDPGSTPVASAATPEASQTRAAPVAPTVIGEAVPAGAILPKGQFAYALPDGSSVLVATDKPLPVPVRADMQAKTDAVPTSNTTTSQQGAEYTAGVQVLRDMGDISGEIMRRTGKIAIMVMYTATSNDSENIVTWVALSKQGSPAGIQGSTAEAVVAQIQPWVDARPNADQWEIIVRAK